MAAPTFVTSGAGASWDTTTSPKATAGLTTLTGDLVVSGVIDENDDGTENFAWTSSVAETWTEQTESTGTTNSDVFLQSARAICSSGWTGGTVTATRSAGGANKYGVLAAAWRDHGGVGTVTNSAQLTGSTPSTSFTTTAANSAIMLFAGDFAARDGVSRTYTTINGGAATELAYFRNSANYTIYVAYWADAGAAGAKTVQINGLALAVMRFHMVEILAPVGGAALPPIIVMPPRRP